ncbi:hypothetical protein [Streptomyces sp. NPDC014734]|uniref:hypothetical protein n=1 Tax=Streptomyces sp. NPDC014734 TaxID=3364886 RepID=UPI0036FFF284
MREEHVEAGELTMAAIENRDSGRMRRSEMNGVAATVLGTVVVVVCAAAGAGLPWWAVAGAALLVVWPAAWTGKRIGRRSGIRDQALEPGEDVVGTYTVRPPYTEHTPTALHEGPQYELLVTTRGLQMWERSVLLWRHPWSELRLVVDGPRLRVHHEDREVGVMLLEHPGAVQEIRAAAGRLGAR